MSDALFLACALVLGASATVHALHPLTTASALTRHEILPTSLRSAVAIALPAGEAVLAACLAAAALMGQRTLALASGTAATLVFGLFSGYLYAVLRRHPGISLPCACGIGTASIGPWSVMRGLLLMVLAAVGAAGSGHRALTARPSEQVVIVVAAAVSLALVLSALPDAREMPAAAALEGVS